MPEFAANAMPPAAGLQGSGDLASDQSRLSDLTGGVEPRQRRDTLRRTPLAPLDCCTALLAGSCGHDLPLKPVRDPDLDDRLAGDTQPLRFSIEGLDHPAREVNVDAALFLAGPAGLGKIEILSDVRTWSAAGRSIVRCSGLGGLLGKALEKRL